jgi:hypothetical protein
LDEVAVGLDRLPSGSIRARLMVGGVNYTATFATEEEARKWSVVTRARALGVRAGRTLTVEDYARRWLGEFIDAAPGLDRYRHDVVEHIFPALGARTLAEISAADVAALLAQVDATVSPRAAEELWVTLRELFADAVDDGIVARSPVPEPASSSCRADRSREARR